MKKTLSLLLVLMILASMLISCTQDASDGIYVQIVTSAYSSKYTIKSFLGCPTPSDYLFVEEHGLYKNGNCLLGGNFSPDAYYDTPTDTAYLVNSDGKLLQVSGFNEENLTITSTDKKWNKVSQYGYAMEMSESKNSIKAIYKIENLETPIVSATDCGGAIHNVLSADGALLIQRCTDFSDESNDNYNNYITYFYNGNEKKPVTTLNGKLLCGFQKACEGVYYVAEANAKDYVYRMTNEGNVVETDSINPPSVNACQMPSFSYINSAGKPVAVFRTASYFDEYLYDSTKTGVEITTHNDRQDGYATYLHSSDVNVVNFVSLQDGTIILATHKNGLYEINPLTGKVDQIKF